MRELRPWLIISLVFFLFFLLWKVPANLLYNRLVDKGTLSEDLVILTNQPQGSWNSGKVTDLSIKGIRISELQWQLQPAALLLGRLQFAMSCDLSQGRSSWSLGVGIKDITIKKLRGELSTAILDVAVPGIKLTGVLKLNDLWFTFTNGQLVKATGQTIWSEAGIGPPYNIALGGLQLDLMTDPNGINTMLRDTGGPLQADIVGKLTENGRYSFDGTINSREGSSPDLASFLQILGQPGKDGMIKVSYRGEIPHT